MAEREETDRDNNRQTNKQTTRDFYRSAIVPDRAGRFSDSSGPGRSFFSKVGFDTALEQNAERSWIGAEEIEQNTKRHEFGKKNMVDPGAPF